MTVQQMRVWYPDFVVGGVDKYFNVTAAQPKCDWSTAKKVNFLASAEFGGSIDLLFHPAAAEAFTALAAVLRAWNYPFREKAGGSVSCRRITGGTRTTLHSHGVAFDINPSLNQYRRAIGFIQWGRQTDMAAGMIADIEAIRTTNGKPVFEWGGRWVNSKDPMHFECSKCTRTDLARGIDWTTVKGIPAATVEDNEMSLKRGAKGPAVAIFQQALKAWKPESLPKYGTDADYGQETEDWVKTYQASAQVPQTGVIDGVTAALLGRYVAKATVAADVASVNLSAYAVKADVAAALAAKADKVHPHTVQ